MNVISPYCTPSRRRYMVGFKICIEFRAVGEMFILDRTSETRQMSGWVDCSAVLRKVTKCNESLLG
jgi:hypothetical protein